MNGKCKRCFAKSSCSFPKECVNGGIQNMKAFRKWWDTEEKIPISATERDIAEAGWRGALLWFYKVAEHLSPSDCALIDKELEDETKKP